MIFEHLSVTKHVKVSSAQPTNSSWPIQDKQHKAR